MRRGEADRTAAARVQQTAASSTCAASGPGPMPISSARWRLPAPLTMASAIGRSVSRQAGRNQQAQRCPHAERRLTATGPWQNTLGDAGHARGGFAGASRGPLLMNEQVRARRGARECRRRRSKRRPCGALRDHRGSGQHVGRASAIEAGAGTTCRGASDGRSHLDRPLDSRRRLSTARRAGRCAACGAALGNGCSPTSASCSRRMRSLTVSYAWRFACWVDGWRRTRPACSTHDPPR